MTPYTRPEQAAVGTGEGRGEGGEEMGGEGEEEMGGEEGCLWGAETTL